jgi:hypothetical protein
MKVFTASLTDIKKALARKPITDLRAKLPDWCSDFLDLFDPKQAEQLPPLYGAETDHYIELEKVDGKTLTVL